MDEYGCNSNSGSGQRVLGGSSTGLVFGPAKVPCGSGRAQGELLLFVLSGLGNGSTYKMIPSIFQGKAKCARCHQGENYTSESNYDVKLEPDGSPYLRWNPPSLRGVFDRGPYLHDGRAKTLEELLEKHHRAEQLGGQALTPQEQRDVIAFLRSL